MLKCIAGDYQLHKKLYSYGLREIYQASSLKTGEKLILVLISVRPGASLAALTRRAKLSQKLKHPKLITAKDFGQASQEKFFYTFPLIETFPLKEFVNTLPVGERDFALTRLLLKLIEPIDYLHRGKITHRDLQTAHIRADSKGELFIDGFINTHPKSELRTRINTVHLPYLAPELFLGAPHDSKTDIYSLGVILFELITDTYPYASNYSKVEDAHEVLKPMEILEQVTISEELRFILMKSLAPRKCRFHSMDSLRETAESYYKKRSLKMKWEDLTSHWKELFSTQ